MERKFTKVGGSLAMLIPRDVVEADRTISDAEFQRAFGAVLRRYGPVYQGLAEYDHGTHDDIARHGARVCRADADDDSVSGYRARLAGVAVEETPGGTRDVAELQSCRLHVPKAGGHSG